MCLFYEKSTIYFSVYMTQLREIIIETFFCKERKHVATVMLPTIGAVVMNEFQPWAELTIPLLFSFAFAFLTNYF